MSERTKSAMRRPDVAARHRQGCKNRIVSAEGRKLQSIAQKKRFETQLHPMSGKKNPFVGDVQLLSFQCCVKIICEENKGDIEYNGCLFRTESEVACAKSLDAMGLRWTYEKDLFSLQNGLSYVPDFRVMVGNGFYLEVKEQKGNLRKALMAKKLVDLFITNGSLSSVKCIVSNFQRKATYSGV